MDLLHLVLLFGIGAVAGFINVNAGGGSSLTLPTLIFMGLEGSVANGTNRIALLVQNIFAVSSFRRNEFHDFKLSTKLGLFTLPGAIAGALVASKISDVLFQRIVGGILIFIVVSLFLSQRMKGQNLVTGKHHWAIYPAMLGIGFYGGFLQIGVGFLLMAALYHLMRLNLVLVNMHKVFIVLIYTVPALAVFILTGNVNWKYGLVLACGNALGGWWGAHAAVKGGEKAIRIILAVGVSIMALKLFGIF